MKHQHPREVLIDRTATKTQIFPPTMFSRFQDLPTELRLQIWHHAMPPQHGRILPLATDQVRARINHPHLKPHGFYWLPWTYDHLETNMASVNKEARKIYLEDFPDSVKWSPFDAVVQYNAKNTVVSIEYAFANDMLKMLPKPLHLAIPLGVFFTRRYDIFQHVESLTILVPARENDNASVLCYLKDLRMKLLRLMGIIDFSGDTLRTPCSQILALTIDGNYYDLTIWPPRSSNLAITDFKF